MAIEFENSITKINLMRSFAGECQARMRYDFIAKQAKKDKLHVIEVLFKLTANQEKAHAKIFYGHLSSFVGKEIAIDGSYPVDMSNDLLSLIESSSQYEQNEHDTIYPSFADSADKEGFLNISSSFRQIAFIEKGHSMRFRTIATLMKNDQLFSNKTPVQWLCLNCGHTHHGTDAPKKCPVCEHAQGFFIREDMSIDAHFGSSNLI